MIRDTDHNTLPSYEFDEDERARLRRVLQEYDRATWLRRQIRVFVPWVAAVVAALWGVIEFLSKHIQWKGMP